MEKLNLSVNKTCKTIKTEVSLNPYIGDLSGDCSLTCLTCLKNLKYDFSTGNDGLIK